ncbi:MAG: hypothetical protein BroJett024_37770 [Alphaproteobacteria bacterium]|nr:MAG: hypothetical protein BroJett024_37770 [Alphaproteobacteria bacterium]
MFCMGRGLDGMTSILAEFALSDYDASHIGRKSPPFMIKVDASAVEKAAYASGCAVPWLLSSAAHSDGGAPRSIAALSFFWYLLNNTPTYRAYESGYVQSGLDANVAHLHTGDDYRYFVPISVGDTITVTCELTKVYEKRGRQGAMKFIEDIWEFRNQDNVLAADLVRKAVTIYPTEPPPPPPPQMGPRLSDLTPATPDVLPPRVFEFVPARDLFDGKPHAYRHEYGTVTWTSMIQWMGAIDDYARTHYDWEYARERGFPGGVPITAGPQMGAAMIAPVLAWAGPFAWMEDFRHIQRRSVNPGDVLTTYGFSKPTNDPDRIAVEAWLVDDKGHIRNSGTFTLRRRSA